MKVLGQEPHINPQPCHRDGAKVEGPTLVLWVRLRIELCLRTPSFGSEGDTETADGSKQPLPKRLWTGREERDGVPASQNVLDGPREGSGFGIPQRLELRRPLANRRQNYT